jgi:AcrR family transcriptional regulator
VTDTRRKLVDGAIETLRTHGIAGTSARTIAASAGVNQALVFYYFGTMDSLLDTACRESTAERVALYRDRFAAVASLRELLALGRELHVTEREAGNVAVLAQVLAGAQQDQGLAAAARDRAIRGRGRRLGDRGHRGTRTARPAGGGHRRSGPGGQAGAENKASSRQLASA